MSDLAGLVGRDAVVNIVCELCTELDGGIQWENDSLPAYLEAFGALLGSIENAYINSGQPVPEDPWELIGRALKGARDYE